MLASGLLIASGTAWYRWSRLGWNVSGHVTFVLVPTLYLTLEERSYWPLLAIPVVMISNRPLVEIHAWPSRSAGSCWG